MPTALMPGVGIALAGGARALKGRLFVFAAASLKPILNDTATKLDGELAFS